MSAAVSAIIGSRDGARLSPSWWIEAVTGAALMGVAGKSKKARHWVVGQFEISEPN
jgi:hypothetical protein